MHEAVFDRLDDPFFGPKGPAPGHAVDAVLQEAELGKGEHRRMDEL